MCKDSRFSNFIAIQYTVGNIRTGLLLYGHQHNVACPISDQDTTVCTLLYVSMYSVVMSCGLMSCSMDNQNACAENTFSETENVCAIIIISEDYHFFHMFKNIQVCVCVCVCCMLVHYACAVCKNIWTSLRQNVVIQILSNVIKIFSV